MSIKDFADKIKPVFLPIMVVLLCLIFFGLGRLSAHEENRAPVRVLRHLIEQINTGEKGSSITTEVETAPPLGIQSETVVASKTGSKYYFPWCGAVKRIKPENRVEFTSVALARQAGYEPASNCKGVK